jgi:glycosyltransferase involved in cell wall biosynthesis
MVHFDMRVSVIVPAFNEEATLPSVVSRLVECVRQLHEIIIVDDASSDHTAKVSERLAGDEPRVKTIRHEKNLGKTDALKTGFQHVTGDVIVIQDADLEYDPTDIPDLVRPIADGRADVCLGSRFLRKNGGRVHYFRHYLANKLITFLNNVCTGFNVSDVETGYKAMRREIAQNMVITSNRFGFEVEFVAKCKKGRFRISEIPISYFGRTYKEGKKVGFKDGVQALVYIVRYNLLEREADAFRPGFLEAWHSRVSLDGGR